MRWFLDLLDTGEDALRNPSAWDDPFENFFLARTKVDMGGDIATLGNLADDWYGQCWTTNCDTDAMWRIYSSDRNGVQVKTTVRKLFDNLCRTPAWSPPIQFFVGQVDYKSEDEIKAMMGQLTFADVSIGGQGDGFARLLCIKREAFRHEREVRIMYQSVPRAAGPKGAGGTLRYRLEANAVFDEILLDPRLTDAEVRAMGAGIAALGWRGAAPRSTLYEAPDFLIPAT
ncbi:DUF2971 domain-containing protein [Methylobacterium sp. J-092]|uniref:DUF2971 domain-containing protein n=1 Tax=Methylobacterium sp. J-092 TaxID=2836667 RepID=UPI001FBAEBB0|nr:DUF2971 domain-containing protein [Methylobacterium sp. J-092]MCJ2007057.1 DUF2971 domain-containing protein [Methylobacterium sp. J-092]